MSTDDPSLPSIYITYLDANNLYGWAMSQYMPVGWFEWIAPDQLKHYESYPFFQRLDEGFIFEVDLEYPKELHDLHNDYPLAVEKMSINT